MTWCAIRPAEGDRSSVGRWGAAFNCRSRRWTQVDGGELRQQAVRLSSSSSSVRNLARAVATRISRRVTLPSRCRATVYVWSRDRNALIRGERRPRLNALSREDMNRLHVHVLTEHALDDMISADIPGDGAGCLRRGVVFQLTERMLLGRARGEWNSRMITPSNRTGDAVLVRIDPLIGRRTNAIRTRDARATRATACSPITQIAARVLIER